MSFKKYASEMYVDKKLSALGAVDKATMNQAIAEAITTALANLSTLPTVTANDDGKMMVVRNGSWVMEEYEPCSCATTSIYGVSWDLSASNRTTRTDAAADFADPVPSVAGSDGSSPFDTLMPWAGMEIVEDEDIGVLVSIPKFYYKITKTDTELKMQIADGPAEGFSVSPAHADRGDGKGERDVVYIARYKCVGDKGASVSGAAPVVNMTRSGVRDLITEQAIDGLSMQDYAMFWTTRMLMMVEYATWDMQGAIGYNCGNGSSRENTGATDAMTYHTGTVQDSLDTYGVGVQYRWIEDPWGNVAEWVDGWRVEESAEEGMTWDVYVTTNPAEFSDTEGGVKIGSLPEAVCSGVMISDWTIPSADGYDWAMIPASGTIEIEVGNEYCADYCEFSGPCLSVGGICEPAPYFGAFSLGSYVASLSAGHIGARLQKIP